MTKAIYSIRTNEGYEQSPSLVFIGNNENINLDKIFVSEMVKAETVNEALVNLLTHEHNGLKSFFFSLFTPDVSEYELVCLISKDCGDKLPAPENRHFAVFKDGTSYDLGPLYEGDRFNEDAVEEALLAFRCTPAPR